MSAEEPEVIARIEGACGRLTLNRPKALHALTAQMCKIMSDALLEWQDNPAIKSILIDHAGERGFCAGGDIRKIAESGAGDGVAAAKFFFDEYRLNHQMYYHPIPMVAVMDGIVMGGGAGIALPCRYRVSTERTMFAMPETGIGLIPDVGGGYYLSRLSRGAGFWLGMTGARIKAADCIALGLATHHAAAGEVEALKQKLIDGAHPADAVNALTGDPGPAPITQHLYQMEKLFLKPTADDIFAALEMNGSDWALAQLAVLKTKSPTSLKITARQLRLASLADEFADTLPTEYRIVSRIVRGHDFQEGVRAVIIDKDNAPRWQPASLEAVPQEAVDYLLSPLPPGQEWTPDPRVRVSDPALLA